MIEVQHISKIYGTQKAVDDISFEVGKGTILGFLGPNGAGKSTTMKILSCFIPQESGTAKICGYNIDTESIEVRKNLGYLPEHTPLYLDMYVKEYLQLMAELQGMEKKIIPAKISEMIDKTGLEREKKKKIGELSKGYRQRVGLAQAMIHDPKVLILDEPTSGLDPNQLGEIRKLIRELGKEKTVILSTHIMQEVEAVCDRVIIINKGKIVADDDTANLRKKATSEAVYQVEFDKVVSKDSLMQIGGVKSVRELSAKSWSIVTDSNIDARTPIFDFAVKNNLVLLNITRQEESLEDVFRKLTN